MPQSSDKKFGGHLGLIELREHHSSHTVGLVVEYSPATGETRVRFPDGVPRVLGAESCYASNTHIVSMGKLVNPFASHAKDPRFEPEWRQHRQKRLRFFGFFVQIDSESITLFFMNRRTRLYLMSTILFWPRGPSQAGPSQAGLLH